ncbi:MAG: DUF86 domain-containing protein [Anaerolineae bacterium]|nr:DUF86 domain-containing protein [Anaerolineae bacterium]
MSVQRDNPLILRDILNEAKLAQQFVGDIEYKDFLANPQKKRAVEFSLIVLGEATRTLSVAIRDGYREVGWAMLMETQNRLMLQYANIDYGSVWTTVKEDLPVLEGQIERILVELDAEGKG